MPAPFSFVVGFVSGAQALCRVWGSLVELESCVWPCKRLRSPAMDVSNADMIARDATCNGLYVGSETGRKLVRELGTKTPWTKSWIQSHNSRTMPLSKTHSRTKQDSSVLRIHRDLHLFWRGVIARFSHIALYLHNLILQCWLSHTSPSLA